MVFDSVWFGNMDSNFGTLEISFLAGEIVMIFVRLC